MSPFGSRISAGIPFASASSSRTIPRPVLPEPVMPTMTACVVRSSGSRTSSPPSRSFPSAKPSATARAYPGRGAVARDGALRSCGNATDCRRCSAARPDQEERVATLVCLECGDESDETQGWRAYLDEHDVLVYCAHCATREFGPE